MTSTVTSSGAAPTPQPLRPREVRTPPIAAAGGLISNQFLFRRLAEKARRRLRQLVRRPDVSPWILDPPPVKRTAHVDLLFGLDYLSPNSRLPRLLQEKLGAYGMNVLLVNNANVDKVTEQVAGGWLRPHVYLDLSSYPGDAYERLLYTAARAGVYTIRNIEHTRWIMKAQGHPELEMAGLPVPPSVIFNRDDPDRELTEEERQRIGERCVIKPSGGGLGKGVVLNVLPTVAEIAKARDYDRSDDWLVQKMIRWGKLEHGHDAYIRAYGVCGHRTLLWWQLSGNLGSGGYRPLTWADMERHNLYPAVQIVEKLQKLTQMDYFSVEIAITKEEGPDRFMLIDYLNDQCDLNFEAHSEWSVPESYSVWACERLAEFVWRKKSGTSGSPQSGLFLHDA